MVDGQPESECQGDPGRLDLCDGLAEWRIVAAHGGGDGGLEMEAEVRSLNKGPTLHGRCRVTSRHASQEGASPHLVILLSSTEPGKLFLHVSSISIVLRPDHTTPCRPHMCQSGGPSPILPVDDVQRQQLQPKLQRVCRSPPLQERDAGVGSTVNRRTARETRKGGTCQDKHLNGLAPTHLAPLVRRLFPTTVSLLYLCAASTNTSLQTAWRTTPVTTAMAAIRNSASQRPGLAVSLPAVSSGVSASPSPARLMIPAPS